MKIISADPGISGAICVKDGKTISVFDMPTEKNKKGKKVFNVKGIASVIGEHAPGTALFIIEDVHCLFGNGAVSMFNFGRGKGLLEGVAFANRLRVEYVSPQTWKKGFTELAPPIKDKKSKDTVSLTAKEKQKKKADAKAKARQIAAKLYPQLADRFKTVNSDGRAEATLIATYAEMTFKE